MLRSEFIERTKYEPDFDEYEIIEEAYYEFDGNKDEFCKWWLKARKDGYWKREYEIRKANRRYSKEIISELDELKEQVKGQNDCIMKHIHEKAEWKNKVMLAEEERQRLEEKVNEFNKIMDALSVLKNSL